MQRLRLTKEKINSLSPQRWLDDNKTSFPDGENPWSDLYTENVTEKIGDQIGRRSVDELFLLRVLLADAAEQAYRTFCFVGGPATVRKKAKWRDKAKKQSEALRQTLLGSEDMLSSTVHAAKDLGSRILVPSSETKLKIDFLVSQLGQFIEILDDAAKQPSTDDEDGGTGAKITPHSRYLQFVVDSMTEVFIKFEGRKNVKRRSDKFGIYGPFPEFIRAASDPCLLTNYAGYRDNPKRPSNLDVQIKSAVEKYGI